MKPRKFWSSCTFCRFWKRAAFYRIFF